MVGALEARSHLSLTRRDRTLEFNMLGLVSGRTWEMLASQEVSSVLRPEIRVDLQLHVFVFCVSDKMCFAVV